MEKKKFVTVFGSSIPKPGDEEYEIAYKLGIALGQNNLNVCTGGYKGIMDALSKGCTESGGEAWGITLDIYNAEPSKYLTKEIKCHTLAERLQKLIETGDAYIVLQGGTGTLVELALVWEYFNKSMISEKPFACHGQMWQKICAVMEEQIKKEKRKTGLILPFESIDECGKYIISSLNN